MTDTITLLKQQFTTLCQQRDAILVQVTPLREQRDGLIQQAEAAIAAQVASLNRQIATTETGLSDVMNQIAQISNALGGKTA
jgi:uncharacterized coiled-coil DUF342 family protein